MEQTKCGSIPDRSERRASKGNAWETGTNPIKQLDHWHACIKVSTDEHQWQNPRPKVPHR